MLLKILEGAEQHLRMNDEILSVNRLEVGESALEHGKTWKACKHNI
jgi:hypothetical protein